VAVCVCPANATRFFIFVTCLDSVAQHAAENKMDEHNLGTVFGPTLVNEPQTPATMANPAGMGSGAEVVERLLKLWPYVVYGY